MMAMGPRRQLPSITSALAPMYMGPDLVLRNAPSTVAPGSMNIIDGSPITVHDWLTDCDVRPAVMSAKSRRMVSPFAVKMSYRCVMARGISGKSRTKNVLTSAVTSPRRAAMVPSGSFNASPWFNVVMDFTSSGVGSICDAIIRLSCSVCNGNFSERYPTVRYE